MSDAKDYATYSQVEAAVVAATTCSEVTKIVERTDELFHAGALAITDDEWRLMTAVVHKKARELETADSLSTKQEVTA